MVWAARCLDQSIIGHGLDLQPVCQSVDALPVNRIDLCAVTALPLRQPAIRRQGDRMGRPVLHINRRLRVFTMIRKTGRRVHLRMQRATQRNV